MINISPTYVTVIDDRTDNTDTSTPRIGYCGTGDSTSTTGMNARLLSICSTSLITMVLEQESMCTFDDIVEYVQKVWKDEEIEILSEQLLKELSQRILLPDLDLILTTERHKEKDLISLSR